MITIERLECYPIYNASGLATLSLTVYLSDGNFSTVSIPTLEKEASNICPLHEDSTLKPEKNIIETTHYIKNKLSLLLHGLSPFYQEDIDALLSKEAEEITNNALPFYTEVLFFVSLAVALVSAHARKLPLWQYLNEYASTIPLPMVTLFEKNTQKYDVFSMQECMLVPVGASSFSEALHMVSEVSSILEQLLKRDSYTFWIGEKGGFVLLKSDLEERLNLLLHAILLAGYDASSMKIAINAGLLAWEITEGYPLPKNDGFGNSDTLIDFWLSLVQNYPIFSLEDPLSCRDTIGWQKITSKLGMQIHLVSNPAVEKNPSATQDTIMHLLGNTICIKSGQFHTVSACRSFVELAKDNHYTVLFSEHAKETEDHTLADFSVACQASTLKCGGLFGSQHTAKYNRISAIEKEIPFAKLATQRKQNEKIFFSPLQAP